MLKLHKLWFYSYRKATLSLIELLRVYNLKHNKESLTWRKSNLAKRKDHRTNSLWRSKKWRKKSRWKDLCCTLLRSCDCIRPLNWILSMLITMNRFANSRRNTRHSRETAFLWFCLTLSWSEGSQARSCSRRDMRKRSYRAANNTGSSNFTSSSDSCSSQATTTSSHSSLLSFRPYYFTLRNTEKNTGNDKSYNLVMSQQAEATT